MTLMYTVYSKPAQVREAVVAGIQALPLADHTKEVLEQAFFNVDSHLTGDRSSFGFGAAMNPSLLPSEDSYLESDLAVFTRLNRAFEALGLPDSEETEAFYRLVAESIQSHLPLGVPQELSFSGLADD